MTTTTIETRHQEAFELSEPAAAAVPVPLVDGEAANALPEEPLKQSLDRTTILRLASVGFAFFVAGVNDGSIGVLIPYVIRDYGINTRIVSSIYGASFLGWLLVAMTQTHLCQYFDMGLMLALGATTQIISQALRVWKPTFGLFTITFLFASLGQAYQDTQGNTFVSGVKGSHRWLGFIHGMYAGGTFVGPFLANSIASRDSPSRWELFYTVPLGLAVINLIFALVAFREKLRLLRKPRQRSEDENNAPPHPNEKTNRASHLINSTLRTPSVWILSLFYFFYLGTVITAGGWVVEYLVVVREGDLSKMGYVPAGFSGGSFLGRLLLVEPVHHWGEWRMIILFCFLAIGLQLLFWLVPNIIAASVAISLFGFFTGPFFPVGMSLASKLFSPNIHPTAMGFLFVIAQLGGSLFPIMTGIIAANSSVSVMQPILVALLAATTVSWFLVPNPKASGNEALHQE